MYLFICFFRGTPGAHGGSQTRGLIRATAARLHHSYSNAIVCDLHHSSWQYWILDPLSKARDRTHNLMLPSQIRFCYTTAGTPQKGNI